MLKHDYSHGHFYLDLKGVGPRDSSGVRQEPLKPADVMWHVISSYYPEALRPDDEEKLHAWYYSVLDGKRALLLLDNARDHIQIEPLVPPTSCFLLVTSRQHFAISGMYDLNLERMIDDDAKRLLLKIAPRISSHAGQLAKQCGQLPLALELAAKALKEKRTLTPADLIKQLEDRQQRLGLVEASFSLSYDLLSKEQQQRWRLLGVFPDTFDENAAAALWETDTARARNLLADLDRYSLMEWNAETGRFRLHDLAKDFADMCLNETERYAAQRRHALYYSQVLNTADDLYRAGHAKIVQGLALFELEFSNIISGQEWAATNADRDEEVAHICLSFSRSGSRILSLRLHPQDLIIWFNKANKIAQSIEVRRDETLALGNLGIAYKDLCEYKRAIQNFEQALVIAREIGDRFIEGEWLGNLGLVYNHLGKYKRSIEYHGQALMIVREIGDKRNEGIWLGNMAMNYSDIGEYGRAVECYEQALSIIRETGDRKNEGACLGSLGRTYNMMGEHNRAKSYFEQALLMAQEIGFKKAEGVWLTSLGFIHKNQREYKHAIERFEQALVIAREIGDRLNEGVCLKNIGEIHSACGDLSEAEEFMANSLRIFEEIESPNANDVRQWFAESHNKSARSSKRPV